MIMVLLNVKASLLHQNIEGGLVLFSEVDRRFRQLFINDHGEQVNVAGSIMQNSINKIWVTGRAEELLDVIKFDQNLLGLFIRDFLLKKIKGEFIGLTSSLMYLFFPWIESF